MRLLKFSATWCSPCKALTATLKSVDLPIPLEEIDVDTNVEDAVKYGIRSVPTLVLLDENFSEVSRLTGNKKQKELLDWINKYVKE